MKNFRNFRLLETDIISLPGITDAETSKVADALGLGGDQREQLKSAVSKLYNLFVKYDSTLLEINPLAELTDGRGRKSVFVGFLMS